jgi:hypothetical protein
MFEIYADGILWTDSDGAESWCLAEASALADMLEYQMDYDVEMVEI